MFLRGTTLHWRRRAHLCPVKQQELSITGDTVQIYKESVPVAPPFGWKLGEEIGPPLAHRLAPTDDSLECYLDGLLFPFTAFEK